MKWLVSLTILLKAMRSRSLLDSRRLFYFYHVARLGSVSAAEAVLDIAQSALTRQIQQLEAELDEQLLQRNGRGMMLTPAGEILFRQAESILHEPRQQSPRTWNLQPSHKFPCNRCKAASPNTVQIVSLRS